MRLHTPRAEQRRARQGLWLALGLAAILVAYPLGLVLVSLGAPNITWTLGFVVLLVAAVVAAIAFGRNVRHRDRPHPP